MVAPDKGTWPRTVGHNEGTRKVPDIIRTSIVVSALVMAGKNMQEARFQLIGLSLVKTTMGVGVTKELIRAQYYRLVLYFLPCSHL